MDATTWTNAGKTPSPENQSLKVLIRKNVSCGKNYCITISIGDLDSDGEREVREHFSELFDDNLFAFVVSLEKYETGEFHLHAFLSFINKMKFSELRYIITSLYDESSVNIQGCKNKSAWLKYITKEDYNCVYKNVRTKEFSFNFQAFKWSCETSVFRMRDPFVLSHLNISRQLSQLHNENSDLRNVSKFRETYEG